MLTAAHVVGSLSTAWCDEKPQPVYLASRPVPQGGDPHIGNVHESDPAAPADEVELDASITEIQNQVALGNVARHHSLNGAPRRIPSLDDDPDPFFVYKRGITSPQLTYGLLDPTPTALDVVSLDNAGNTVTRRYVRGFLVHGGDGQAPFARAGDSGSAVFDEDDCVVGMVVAVETDELSNPKPDDPAFIVAITEILEKLQVGLVGPIRPCTSR